MSFDMVIIYCSSIVKERKKRFKFHPNAVIVCEETLPRELTEWK
jgi:hypothetical protein